MIADVAYVTLLDQVTNRALSERIVTATLAAAGAKDSANQPLKITDPDAERDAFISRLSQPFRFDRMRKAYLKEVSR